ncbi:MAG: hypothetical protein R3C10_07675 [Pirellulales bacterium]
MALTTDEFNSFADFGRARLESGSQDLTLDDLVVEWESLHNRDQIKAALCEGLADADTGRHRPAADVISELRAKHGLPPR